MRCPKCHAECMDDEIDCPQCGADLLSSSTSMMRAQSYLPSVLQNRPLARRVAASVGALTLGVGIELLRRGLIARLTQSATVEETLPALSSLKDILGSREKPAKRLKKGYEVEETIVYVRRVTRR